MIGICSYCVLDRPVFERCQTLLHPELTCGGLSSWPMGPTKETSQPHPSQQYIVNVVIFRSVNIWNYPKVKSNLYVGPVNIFPKFWYYRAIMWINLDSLSIGPLWTNKTKQICMQCCLQKISHFVKPSHVERWLIFSRQCVQMWIQVHMYHNILIKV